ncbi:MAG TPA: hypothetical protein VIS95_04675 [Solirubrobacterales bacterium]
MPPAAPTMAAPPATSGTFAFFAAPPTAFVALSAALLIATPAAGFAELDELDFDEFVRFRGELGFRELDGLRLDGALVLVLVLV